jgi:hypothetical protein
MYKDDGAHFAPSDSHLGVIDIEKALFGDSTQPITPVERPRQVEEVAQQREKAKTTEVSDRLRTVPAFNAETVKKAEVKQEEKLDYSQHEEVVTVDNMLNFDRDHDESTLLGNRWLCKGAQAVIHGPTGVGKSSLIMQASIRWILGRSFFGIKPVKSMKILLIQAENDMGDMSEAFQDMTNAMSNKDIAKDEVLTNADLDAIRERLVIRRVDSLSGIEFVQYLSHAIDEHKPDIVFVDPLLAYIGGDSLKQEVMSKFLRNLINPILRRTGVLLFWVHHIGKPGKQATGQEKSAEEHKYSGLGSSELQNACREVISLSDEGGGTFKLEFTKRGRRTGIKDERGKPMTAFNIEHHKDGIVWVKCKGAKATANKAGQKAIKDAEKLYEYIVQKGRVSSPELKGWAPAAGIAVNNVVNIANSIASEWRQYKKDGKKPIFQTVDNDPKRKGIKPQVFTTEMPDHVKAQYLADLAREEEERSDAERQKSDELWDMVAKGELNPRDIC